MAPENITLAGQDAVPAGRVIDAKYRLAARLGAGGMGTVYRATRLLIGDEVAVKVLHPALVSDEQAAERFRREAQAAARLKHPNAVGVYDFGVTEDGLVYLVMELVGGESLREVISRQGPLAPVVAAEITRQVCAALDEAHRQGVVHRDVKPDNILVAETPQGLCIKVLDFGIARLRDIAPAAGGLTQTGMMVGTPRYMSPEQCLGEEVDGRSDIYSLGVVLFEMLTGTVPFNSPTPTAVAVQHATQPPPSPRAINMNVPGAVETVVLRALGKRREERPQTASAFAQELTEAEREGTLQRGSVQAAPPLARPAGAAFPYASDDSGSMRTVVLDAAARPAVGPNAAGLPAVRATVSPADRRGLASWLGGLAAGILIAVGAFVLVLRSDLVGAGPRETADAGGVNRNASDVNMRQPLAPPAKEATPPPAATMPTPKATPAARQASATVADNQSVRSSLEGWAAATRAHDFETHMSFYADILSFYYKRANVGVASVRADRARAFTRYAKLDVQLSNMVVTPDPSGLTASATFDKSWSFEGDKYSSGSVRQLVTLANYGGRWLITGEKDLQVYYVNR